MADPRKRPLEKSNNDTPTGPAEKKQKTDSVSNMENKHSPPVLDENAIRLFKFMKSNQQFEFLTNLISSNNENDLSLCFAYSLYFDKANFDSVWLFFITNNTVTHFILRNELNTVREILQFLFWLAEAIEKKQINEDFKSSCHKEITSLNIHQKIFENFCLNKQLSNADIKTLFSEIKINLATCDTSIVEKILVSSECSRNWIRDRLITLAEIGYPFPNNFVAFILRNIISDDDRTFLLESLAAKIKLNFSDEGLMDLAAGPLEWGIDTRPNLDNDIEETIKFIISKKLYPINYVLIDFLIKNGAPPSKNIEVLARYGMYQECKERMVAIGEDKNELANINPFLVAINSLSQSPSIDKLKDYLATISYFVKKAPAEWLGVDPRTREVSDYLPTIYTSSFLIAYMKLIITSYQAEFVHTKELSLGVLDVFEQLNYFIARECGDNNQNIFFKCLFIIYDCYTNSNLPGFLECSHFLKAAMMICIRSGEEAYLYEEILSINNEKGFSLLIDLIHFNPAVLYGSHTKNYNILSYIIRFKAPTDLRDFLMALNKCSQIPLITRFPALLTELIKAYQVWDFLDNKKNWNAHQQTSLDNIDLLLKWGYQLIQENFLEIMGLLFKYKDFFNPHIEHLRKNPNYKNHIDQYIQQRNAQLAIENKVPLREVKSIAEDKQNTHLAGVHLSAAESALRLQNQYIAKLSTEQLDIEINKTVTAIDKLLKNVAQQKENVDIIFTAYRWLTITFLNIKKEIESNSKLSIGCTLHCIWQAIHDEKHFNPEQQKNLEQELITTLAKLQTEYGVNSNGADIPTCVGGHFNDLIAILHEKHPLVYISMLSPSTLINFITDFLEMKYEKTNYIEKQKLSAEILHSGCFPKVFCDQYRNEFIVAQKINIAKKYISEKNINDTFAVLQEYTVPINRPASDFILNLFVNYTEHCFQNLDKEQKKSAILFSNKLSPEFIQVCKMKIAVTRIEELKKYQLDKDIINFQKALDNCFDKIAKLPLSRFKSISESLVLNDLGLFGTAVNTSRSQSSNFHDNYSP